MSISANTRLFKGSILAVDDLAMSWVTTGEIIDATGFGNAATVIDTTTAASNIEESLIGLPDQGDATLNFFLEMDDDFQQTMETMRDAQQTRTFQIRLPEGTLNTCTFDAFVVDANITGAVNDVYKMTLVLCIVTNKVWTAV